MELSSEDAKAALESLRQEGFCFLPLPAPATACAVARAAIERELQQHGRVKDPLNGHCPALLASPAIQQLFYSSQAHAAASAVLLHGAG